MKKIISVIGARPQFIKHAPMQIELQKHFEALTLHTGQHFDENMSGVFFNELNLPKPDFLLSNTKASLQGEQTALMMIEIEKIFIDHKPDAVVVYGDTNSTLAGTLTAAKMAIPILHIEAGLRSYNRQMPEEINRIVADTFAEMLFCPTDNAVENLKKEGVDERKIYRCGDVMADMVAMMKPLLKKNRTSPYYFTTIHRPYNTDDISRLPIILKTLNDLDKAVVFAIHPRTALQMKSMNLKKADYKNIEFIDPLGYVDSLSYQYFSDCVITDSGGIQKEAYILQKKCVTIRSETEWTETLVNGWNTLIFDPIDKLQEVLLHKPGHYVDGVFGNGHTAKYICNILLEQL